MMAFVSGLVGVLFAGDLWRYLIGLVGVTGDGGVPWRPGDDTGISKSQKTDDRVDAAYRGCTGCMVVFTAVLLVILAGACLAGFG